MDAATEVRRGVSVIYLYHREIDGVWYASALEKNKVVATAFSFSEKDVLQRLLRSLPYNVPFQVAEKPSSTSQKLLKTLNKIYDGKSVSSTSEMDMSYLSSYARGTLKCMMKIPIGYVTTYGAVAKVVGGSPRAVGRVAASNPFPLLIPCHRVVKAYRGESRACSVGGYGLGNEVKLGLLRREDRGYTEPTTVEVDDKVLSLSPVSYVKEL